MGFKRHSMSRSKSKRLFHKTAGARHMHKKNFLMGSMRGGIRL
ncbi:MAG: hypothetical protein [Arizlama microvirus]|nr:MAG: hypothetical protein [Arizlama microvirus]